MSDNIEHNIEHIASLPQPREMRIVPARQGLAWLTQGLKLVLRRPFGWSLLMLSLLMLVSLISAIPLLGGLLVTASFPFCILLVVWFSDIVAGATPQQAAASMQSIRRQMRPLCWLALSYFLLLTLAFGLTALADGGQLFQLFMGQRGKPMGPDTFDASEAQLAGLIALLLLTPLGMAYWFAPMLVAWQGMSPAKALFFSFFASLRNWRAATVYTLGLMALAILGSLLAGMLIGSFGAAGNAAGLMMLSIGILSLLLSFIVFASIQPSYVEVFPATNPSSTEPEQH